MAELEPHEAGYMKPPKKHRFKPGQSGNPKGRPKRIDHPYASLQKVLARRITVKAYVGKITIQEALLRRLRDRALAGTRRAIALQQKILAIASAAQSRTGPPVDIEEVKLRLARMVGLEADETSEGTDEG